MDDTGYAQLPTSLKLARLRMAAALGRDVTQEEMAEKVGMSRSRYSALEGGSYHPSKALARKIGAITGQTVGEVIDEYEALASDAQKAVAS